MGRLGRLRGVVGFGARYAVARLFRAETRQSALAVVGVAVAVALVLSVTSVAVGLAAGPDAGGGDYWIVPEDGASSVVTGVERQRLGRVHATADRIERLEGVASATPLLATAGRVDGEAGGKYLFLVGIVPAEGGGGDGASPADGGSGRAARVVGLSTAALEPGDPYFANGSYDGRRTGQAVLSAGAAEALSAGAGDSFTLATGARDANRTFAVAAVEEPRTAGLGQFPVAVVHLSELQAITGAASGDAADRIRVTTTGPGVAGRLAGIYPNSEVLTDAELRRQRVLDSRLTVAVAVASFVVAVAVGCLFVATTMGFELAAEHRSRAVMRAVGLSRATLVTVVAVQTLTVCLLGGAVGVLLWVLVALGVNLAGTALLSTGAVAVLRPELAAAGIGAALLVGLLTLPYLLVVSDRTAASEALTA